MKIVQYVYMTGVPNLWTGSGLLATVLQNMCAHPPTCASAVAAGHKQDTTPCGAKRNRCCTLVDENRMPPYLRAQKWADAMP